MRRPKCGRVMLVDVPRIRKNGDFTSLFDTNGVEPMKDTPPMSPDGVSV